MRYLGADLGTKTLGLAKSDINGIISSPYKLIKYNDINKLIDEVIDIIINEKIDEFILGYPKNMNNTLGPATLRSLEFKELLESKIDIKIHLVDERLSTVEAEKILISADLSRGKRKKVIDEVSAAIILDTYLRKLGKNG